MIAAAVLGLQSSSGRAETVGDRLWVWGHPAGVYNDDFIQPLGRKSTIEPVAAAERMGLKNMIFVRYNGEPAAPFDSYYPPFRKLERVYWSLVAAGGGTSQKDREAAYALAEKHENIVGFILDDFFHSPSEGNAADPLPPAEASRSSFTASLSPAELRALGQRKVRGRKLPIMAVIYTMQVKPQARAHIAEVDELCLWTWRPEDLKNLESNFVALEKLAPDKRLYLGCYMYDFHTCKPLPRGAHAAAGGARLRVAEGGTYCRHDLPGHAERRRRPGCRRVDPAVDPHLRGPGAPGGRCAAGTITRTMGRG